jgi:hypothetical protein
MAECNAEVKPSFFEWVYAEPDVARFVTDSHLKMAEGTGQIAWVQEPFFLHPDNYQIALEKPFDYVITHNRYFADNNHNWLWCNSAGSRISMNLWKMYEKTKDVSILLSHKKSMFGHRMRHDIVQMYGDKMDVFGLDNYIPNKVEALAPYRFSFIIENESCPGGFSEKIIDCISTGTIPVYWGCPNISDYFDARGILQFETIHEIGEILTLLNEENYNNMLPYAKKNMEIIDKYTICEDYIYKEYPFLFEENK